MTTREHWESIYSTKAYDEVSWYQRAPRVSLDLIRKVAHREAVAIDVGGGASTLVDALLEEGYHNVTVLDVAESGLAQAKRRLGLGASRVRWMCCDVLRAELPSSSFDLWHDRAVFHFLTAPADRRRYVEQMERSLRPGGHVVLATFAEDGPRRCSGLDVMRFGLAELQAELGDRFELVDSAREIHETPAGVGQSFQYCVCSLRSDRPSGLRVPRLA